MVIQVNGGPPLEGDEREQCKLGNGPTGIVAHKEEAHDSHGRMQRRQRTKNDWRCMESLGHHMGTGAKRCPNKSCSISGGIVIGMAMLTVQLDKPRWGIRENQVGEHSSNVLSTQGNRKKSEGSWSMENVEPDGREERNTEMPNNVGEPRHNVFCRA